MYRKCVTELSVRHQKQVEDALLSLMEKMTESQKEVAV